MSKIANWPGWETVRLIGRGSFGAVYEIQRDIFGDVEKAALKVISIPQNESDIEEMYSDGYDEESITSTFQSHLKSIVAEYSLMRKMNGSSNIVNCDDVRYVQHDDGIGWDIFIKMELLTPLTKALPNEIPEEAVVKIAKDMCTALELCKRHEIVHRDIKPQNIFVSANGDYKLGDFGIAKTVEKTMGGTKIGTYKYMAPEVYNNQPYGSSADIYSLGLVLYWLLNERRMPFLPLPPAKLKAGMDEDARYRRLSGEQIPAPANGSDKLKAIVLKACAYEPTERYHSATEMLDALTALSTKTIEGTTTILTNTRQEDFEDFSATQVPQKYFEDEDKTVGPVFSSPCQEQPTPTESNTSKTERESAHPVGKSPTKRKGMLWPIFPIIAVIILGTVMFIADITQKQKTPVDNSYVISDSGLKVLVGDPSFIPEEFQFESSQINITAQPQDVASNERGELITTQVVASGDGLVYQWYYRLDWGGSFVKDASQTSDTYCISYYKNSPETRFVFCVIADQYGNKQTSDVATIQYTYYNP